MPTLIRKPMNSYDWFINYLKKPPEEKGYIETGYEQLDGYIGGLNRGNIIILGAEPGVGKTTLGINIIYNLIRERHLVFPTENTREHWMGKFLSRVSGIDHRTIRTRSHEIIDDLLPHVRDLARRNLRVVTVYRPTVEIIRQQVEAFKPSVLSIDYFQNIYVRDRSAREYADKVEALHKIAMDYNIPVILGSQLRRVGEKETDSVPDLTRLKETGKLEEAAKTVIMLQQTKGTLNAHVIKNNDGELGVVRFKPTWTTNLLEETI